MPSKYEHDSTNTCTFKDTHTYQEKINPVLKANGYLLNIEHLKLKRSDLRYKFYSWIDCTLIPAGVCMFM